MKTLQTILIAALVLFSFEWTAAQPAGRFPQIRERVSNVRFNQIAKRMEIDDERLEKLRPVYFQFENERQEMMDGRLIRQMRVSPDSLSDEQAEQLFYTQMEKARRMIELREKYFKEFQKVLSPKEILRFHRIEREVNKRMMQQVKERFNNFKN